MQVSPDARPSAQPADDILHRLVALMPAYRARLAGVPNSCAHPVERRSGFGKSNPAPLADALRSLKDRRVDAQTAWM